jgi:two-component system sensor histidine kinase KdpD
LHIERTLVERSALQASEEAKSQKFRNTLLAAISHDYRTPLANILGAATSLIAQSDRLSREQARALTLTIVGEVGRLSTMTDNTLQLARLDTEGVHISKDWESLEELIGSAVARARSRFADVRVGLRIEPHLPLLHCDGQLILQLLDNLIDNAVKYGGTQQTVEIIARKLESNLLLSVADRGPGIPASQRERIFQLFERGAMRSATTEGGSPRGAGLGLALCRAIVSAHGGSIHAKQRQRGGTSMDCLFPVEAQPQAMSAGDV